MRVSKAYNSFQAMIALNTRVAPGASYGGNFAHLALFSGTPPTDDQLLSLITTSNTQVPWSASAIAAFATASNFLGNVSLAAFTAQQDLDANICLLPLSSQANTMTIAQSGTPTWFMFRVTSAGMATDTFAAFTGGTNLQTCIVGTVGDENSTADLKILGGTVTAGQPLRVPDLRIKF